MKLTQEQLRQIIREELSRLDEKWTGPDNLIQHFKQGTLRDLQIVWDKLDEAQDRIDMIVQSFEYAGSATTDALPDIKKLAKAIDRVKAQTTGVHLKVAK